MKLIDLKKGQKGRIVSFENKEIQSVFLLFGLLPDSVVEVKRRVPFGGSLYLSFNQTLMAVRKSEASLVRIEIV